MRRTVSWGAKESSARTRPEANPLRTTSAAMTAQAWTLRLQIVERLSRVPPTRANETSVPAVPSYHDLAPAHHTRSILHQQHRTIPRSPGTGTLGQRLRSRVLQRNGPSTCIGRVYSVPGAAQQPFSGSAAAPFAPQSPAQQLPLLPTATASAALSDPSRAATHVRKRGGRQGS